MTLAQPAKAAIAAGIQTLLESSNTTCEEIETFYLAGGFGSHLRVESAAAIGLIPESLEVLTGCKVEAGLAQIAMPEKGKTAEGFQFMRQGYFCLDNRDATPEHLVFNRSVALKDSFKA